MTNYEQNFLNACKAGDLSDVKHFLKNGMDIHLSQEQAFSNACSSQNIELIDYLLSSPELTEHSKINPEFNEDLLRSCMVGNKEIVKKLFELPIFQKQKRDNLKEHKILLIEAFKKACNCSKIKMIEFFIYELPPDDTRIVFNDLNRGFVAACANGKLEAVKFLFNNEKTGPLINPNAYENAALRLTIYNGYQPIIQYLLTEQSHKTLISDELKSWVFERPDISIDVKNYFFDTLKIIENKQLLAVSIPDKSESQIKKNKI